MPLARIAKALAEMTMSRMREGPDLFLPAEQLKLFLIICCGFPPEIISSTIVEDSVALFET